MSTKTWKEEFYPVTAAKFAAPKKRTTVELVQHSLTKWEGLRPKNKKKHGVVLQNEVLVNREKGDHGYVIIAGNSCTLCKRFYPNCNICPLSLGKSGDGCGSEYGSFISSGAVTPMIKLLKKGLAYAKKQEAAAKEAAKK